MTLGTNGIDFKIYRFNPRTDKAPRYQTYKVPIKMGWSLLNALEYIYENLDTSLSFYASCRIGKCNGCLVLVNGKSKRACTTPAKENMTIEPLKTFTLIKDLIVDLDKPKTGKID